MQAFIDAHVHVWTPDTAHYPLAAGCKKENLLPPSFTPQELFKHTKPAGVTFLRLRQSLDDLTSDNCRKAHVSGVPAMSKSGRAYSYIRFSSVQQARGGIRYRLCVSRCYPNCSRICLAAWSRETVGASDSPDAL